MTAKTPAERQRKRRQRKAEQGLVKVESWVPRSTVWAMKELEERLCAAQPDYDHTLTGDYDSGND